MSVKHGECTEYVRIVLIDDLPFRRASIKSLLENWAREDGLRLDAVETTGHTGLEQLIGTVQLVVYNVGGVSMEAVEWRRNIDELRQQLPDVPLVIISERDNAGDVVEALKAGARGFISAQIAPSIVFQALRFIMGGGVYFPPSALLQAQAIAQSGDWRRPGPANGVDQRQCGSLTARQNAVWRLLQHGHSNKVIARELAMCESTVKVHMRQIMRKLGASNRTQAALCGGEPGPAVDIQPAAITEVGGAEPSTLGI